MHKSPCNSKKSTSTASSDNTPPASSTENISGQENPATATITVTAVEVPELTEEEQSDKPDGRLRLPPASRTPCGKSVF